MSKEPILKLKDYLNKSVIDISKKRYARLILKDIPDLLDYEIYFEKSYSGYYEKTTALKEIEVDTKKKHIYFTFIDNDD